jgi:hypothetical protein
MGYILPISVTIVAIEKNPKTNTAIAEKPSANKFLNLICRTTDTTANKATNKNIIAKTIRNTSSL